MSVLKKGDQGQKVRELQEWLSLHDFGVTIDGSFGPVTEAVTKRFQANVGLEASGCIGTRTWAALRGPMNRATELSDRANPRNVSFRDAIVEYARQHLIEHPREIGGQNCGPWVRLYCNGKDGTPYAWCAGFVSYIILQAVHHHGVARPIMPSLSCDRLAGDALSKNRLVRYASRSDDDVQGDLHPSALVRPGDVFLVHRQESDWTHTGIVTGISSDSILTIEGNTNDEGSREGYEVCSRTRSYKRLDFINTKATQKLTC